MNVPLNSQVFDLVFHPEHSTVYAGLLTGQVKGVSYDHFGNHNIALSLTLSNKSIRTVELNQDGSTLFAGGKAKAL
jgi:WD repeat-containing protein 55